MDQPELPHGFVGCPLKFTFRGLLEDPENVEKADILTSGGSVGMGMRVDSHRTFTGRSYSIDCGRTCDCSGVWGLGV